MINLIKGYEINCEVVKAAEVMLWIFAPYEMYKNHKTAYVQSCQSFSQICMPRTKLSLPTPYWSTELVVLSFHSQELLLFSCWFSLLPQGPS